MLEVKCNHCSKIFFRSRRRINENKKLGQNSYCSKVCQGNFLNRRAIFVCENQNCNKKFEKFRKDVGVHNYCSRSCAVIINNKKFPKLIVKLKECGICGKQFKGANIYCSEVCYKKTRIKHHPQDLIKSIISLHKKLGRTPAKREFPEIVSACIYAFGSWNKAITKAGLKPNRSHNHRMYKRVMTKANDGHSCDSISEAIIDNWLASNKINHKRNVVYPNTNHRADWGLDSGAYIEYFGLANDSPRYDRDIQIKRDICKKHRIKLIEIYPNDLYPRQDLKVKLSELVSS